MIWIDYIKPQLCLEIQFNYFKPLRFLSAKIQIMYCGYI